MLRAVERLALNDAAIEWEREQSPALGMGLRMGFLGVLHMEVREVALTGVRSMSHCMHTVVVHYVSSS